MVRLIRTVCGNPPCGACIQPIVCRYTPSEPEPMASTPGYWSSDNCQARAQRFGRFLVSWRQRCGWSQYEIPKWADACGFIGPAVGTVSQLERGRVTTPTMGLFAGLAEVNRRLVAQDFSGVASRKLLDRLTAGVPVLTEDGTPWGFHEFVSAFHLPHEVNGEIWASTASSNTPAPSLDAVELERVNAALAAGFHEVARQTGLRSKALNLAGKAAPASERVEFEDALLFGYQREQLQKLWDPDAGQWLPLLWLAAVQRENSSGIA